MGGAHPGKQRNKPTTFFKTLNGSRQNILAPGSYGSCQGVAAGRCSATPTADNVSCLLVCAGAELNLHLWPSKKKKRQPKAMCPCICTFNKLEPCFSKYTRYELFRGRKGKEAYAVVL